MITALCLCKKKCTYFRGLPWCSDGKQSTCNVGNLGSIPGSRRSPVEGNGNPLLYSCLENPIDRGAWQATAHGSQKSQTQVSDWTTANSSRSPKFLLLRGCRPATLASCGSSLEMQGLRPYPGPPESGSAFSPSPRVKMQSLACPFRFEKWRR